MVSAMSSASTMIRPWSASVARCLPCTSVRIEFCAELNSSRFSSSGRSEATAIIIPKTVETSASSDRPPRISDRRSFFKRGRPGGGGSGRTVMSGRSRSLILRMEARSRHPGASAVIPRGGGGDRPHGGAGL
jgi:hypothetical protein